MMCLMQACLIRLGRNSMIGSLYLAMSEGDNSCDPALNVAVVSYYSKKNVFSSPTSMLP